MWHHFAAALAMAASCFMPLPASANMPPTTFATFQVPVGTEVGDSMVQAAGVVLGQQGFATSSPNGLSWRTPSSPPGYASLVMRDKHTLQMALYGAVTPEQEDRLIAATHSRLESQLERQVAVATQRVAHTPTLFSTSSLMKLAIVFAVNIGATWFLYLFYIGVTRRVFAWRRRLWGRVTTVYAKDEPATYTLLLLLSLPLLVGVLGYLWAAQHLVLRGDLMTLMSLTGVQLAWSMYRHPINARVRGVPYAISALVAVAISCVAWPLALAWLLRLWPHPEQLAGRTIGIVALAVGYSALWILLQSAIRRHRASAAPAAPR